jgi:LmbE family N-acetylglucosaminyl deacetylase
VRTELAVRTVTPEGHGLNVWADRIAEAETLTLASVLGRLGLRVATNTLLVLAAHPDDEALGFGRLMHTWSRRGAVHAVVATAGEACVDHVIERPANLGERRLQEWEVALDTLGVRSRSYLGLPDGRVAEHTSDLADGLRAWLDEHPDEQVILAAPWRHDPDPDHRACGRVAAAVATERRLPLLQFPVWMTYWADPTSAEAESMSLIKVSTDVIADLAHRRAAAAFVSQFDPLRDDLGPVVPAGMLRHHSQQLLILPESA